MKKSPKNPWLELNEWLYNPNPDAELSEETIKKLNPCSILAQFSNLYSLTIFLNTHFNDLNTIFQLPPLEFYKFIREIIQKKNIKKYRLSFVKNIKKDKTLGEARKRLPHLKSYEIRQLLEFCKRDKEENGFLQFLGLEETKLKKLTKKDKMPETNEELQITMEDLLKNFE